MPDTCGQLWNGGSAYGQRRTILGAVPTPTDQRVAVWVAVHHSAAPSREDQPRRLVQFEPIRTAVPRAANAVGWQHPPGFKSPILRFLSSGTPTQWWRTCRCSFASASSGHAALFLAGVLAGGPLAVMRCEPSRCGIAPVLTVALWHYDGCRPGPEVGFGLRARLPGLMFLAGCPWSVRPWVLRQGALGHVRDAPGPAALHSRRCTHGAALTALHSRRCTHGAVLTALYSAVIHVVTTGLVDNFGACGGSRRCRRFFVHRLWIQFQGLDQVFCFQHLISPQG